MNSKSICFGFLFLPVVFGDLDYLTPVLGTQSPSCQSIFHQTYCYMKCNEKNALCVKDKCFCLSHAVAQDVKIKNNHEYQIDEVIDDAVSGESEVQDQTRIDNIPLFALRPTVRHHIAHFCPNLDVARECITKCMALGKPAFCGKDHVCYCGHKYSSTDDNSKVDIKQMYAQFNDLYAKYFGTDHSNEREDTQIVQ